jgi:hypothetical protein
MSNTDFVLTADSEFDDLPRSLRREREAREREKREREQADLSRTSDDHVPKILRSDSSLHVPRNYDIDDAEGDASSYPPATVRRLEIPFLHLMMFFLKAVVAAVPALILLGAILWGMGQTLQALFPWLVKMQIFIQFPH